MGKWSKFKGTLTALVVEDDPDAPGFESKVADARARLTSGDPADAALDPDLEVPASYCDALAAARTRAAGEPGLIAFADVYHAARQAKDLLEARIDLLNIEIAAAERELVATMERQGVDQVRTRAGLFSLKDEPYARVVDKPAYMAAVFAGAAAAAADLAREGATVEEIARAIALQAPHVSVPWQTTNSAVKSALEEGAAPPPGVEAFMKSGIGRRAAKTD